MKLFLVTFLFLAFTVGVSAAEKTTLHLAAIENVDTSSPQGGKITVTLTYYRDCSDTLVTVVKQEAGPVSLSNPHYVVGVVVESHVVPGQLKCQSIARETASFELPAIAGGYTISPIEPQ